MLPPDFVHRPGVNYEGIVPVAGRPASWYSVAKQDGVGPFGYLFFQDQVTGANTSFPAGHFGHNLFGLPGWRWQNYLYFDVSKPPQEVFEIPSACLNAQACVAQTPPPGFGNTTTIATTTTAPVRIR